ncbi:MAG: vitamin K epoxide reductase family protein [Solirubrobacterales bacterium]|nr:vitamin K epoxide reductase family protein [Solirubrobacterales bacterium]
MARLTPPRSKLLIAILVFGVIGLIVAGYTTYVHYFPAAQVCKEGGTFNCTAVQTSQWSEVAGIPVALMGLIGYLLLLGSLLVRGELGRAAGFAIALIGFLFSMYLTAREVFSIKSLCWECLISALCMTVLMVLMGIRFWRTPAAVSTTAS